MAEETITDPGTFMRAFDQARNIGNDEARIGSKVDHPQVRVQRCERIGGDFRVRAADGGQEGGFAGIGQADQPGIGNQLQAQPYPAFNAGFALLGMTRRLIGRGFEEGIALSAAPAFHQQDALAGLGQVKEHGLAVLVHDLGADRQFQDHILSGPARAVGP